MTQEEKELFKKDIAARLPYEPLVTNANIAGGHEHQLWLGEHSISKYFDSSFIDDTKVYLRPMSAMTKQEDEEWWSFAKEQTVVEEQIASLDWLNKHHFDYRGLIDKGFALEAPEGMYK